MKYIQIKYLKEITLILIISLFIPDFALGQILGNQTININEAKALSQNVKQQIVLVKKQIAQAESDLIAGIASARNNIKQAKQGNTSQISQVDAVIIAKLDSLKKADSDYLEKQRDKVKQAQQDLDNGIYKNIPGGEASLRNEINLANASIARSQEQLNKQIETVRKDLNSKLQGSKSTINGDLKVANDNVEKYRVEILSILGNAQIQIGALNNAVAALDSEIAKAAPDASSVSVSQAVFALLKSPLSLNNLVVFVPGSSNFQPPKTEILQADNFSIMIDRPLIAINRPDVAPNSFIPAAVPVSPQDTAQGDIQQPVQAGASAPIPIPIMTNPIQPKPPIAIDNKPKPPKGNYNTVQGGSVITKPSVTPTPTTKPKPKGKKGKKGKKKKN